MSFKREKRLIKNREAASLSRKRHKEYLATLEQQVDALRRENESLRRRVAVLESGGASATMQPGGSLAPPPQGGRRPLARASQIVALMGLALLVIAAPTILQRPLAENDVIGGGRSILSISGAASSASPPPTSALVPLLSAPPAVTSASNVITSSVASPVITSSSTSSSASATLASASLAANLTDSHTPVEPVDLRSWLDQSLRASPKNEPITSVAVHVGSSPASVPFEPRDDTAYMFCAHAMPVMPNEKGAGGSPRLSLLIPQNQGKVITSSDGEHVAKHMQIDCEVVGTRMVSLMMRENEDVVMDADNATAIIM